MVMGTLHRPMILALLWRATASVTIPAGLVKLMMKASGANSSTFRAISSSTGMVRSALAKPPTPVVSWPIRPYFKPRRSSAARAGSWPTRSWVSTNLASRMASSSSKCTLTLTCSSPAFASMRRVSSEIMVTFSRPASTSTKASSVTGSSLKRRIKPSTSSGV